MEDSLQGTHRIELYLQVDRAPEESAVAQRTETHTLPAAMSLYSPSLPWLDQTARENPRPTRNNQDVFKGIQMKLHF